MTIATAYRFSVPLVDAHNTVYNVKSYGAKGDGATDDTAAIQAAMDACNAAGGGIVYFPKGEYAVNTNHIEVGSNTIVQGVGFESKLVAKSTITTAKGILNIDTQTQVVIRDLQVNGTSGSDYAHYGVKLDGSSFCRVDNVYAYNFKDDCITVSYSTDAIVTGCFAGGTMTGSETSNKSCIECDDTSARVIISYNQCIGREIGIHVHAHPDITAPNGVVIVGNFCKDQLEQTVGHETAGIAVTGLSNGGINNVQIVGNTCIGSNTQKWGIYADYVTGLTEMGNHVYGTFITTALSYGSNVINRNLTQGAFSIDTGVAGESSADAGGFMATGQRNGTLWSFIGRHRKGGAAATTDGEGAGIRFAGYDGSAFQMMGAIRVIADGATVSGSASKSKMEFYLTPASSVTHALKATLDSTGVFTPTGPVQLPVLTAEPGTPANGMVVYADGTSWNPGGGAGFYVREGGAWVKK